ncbi:MAG: extracellular solute-binding protein [Lachnospiraceae bacterium]|nr:extracellular solute-binding protein [Lachnospiraceae bacterium]
MRCLNCFKEHDDNIGICPYCGFAISEYMPEAYHLMPGVILDERYMIGIVTGVGGFGIVYKAWDMKLERVVAIKEYYPGSMVNRIPGTTDVIIVSGRNKKTFEYNKDRFLCEARNTVRFAEHKNIINVYEYFEENNTAYMVMDLLIGIPLNKFMKKFEKVSVQNTIYIINNICDALSYLHKQKIIHRDISPDNIYICEDNSIILFDFGTAEFSDDNVKVMDVVVKEGYSPIEQYNNINEQGPWTDMYALGATMYVMLTGVRPPEASVRKVNDELIAPHELDNSIPENISNAVMKAMAVEKHMRFNSIDEFSKAINGEKKVANLKKEKKKKKIKRILATMAALLTVFIGAMVLLGVYGIQKYNATLTSADLTVWIKGEEDSEKYIAMETIAEDFMKAYPKVKIEIVAIPESEYEDKIAAAINSGILPNLFESTGINEKYLNNTLSLRTVINGDNGDNCYFLDDYENVYSSYKKVPMGINLPTVYIITSGTGSIEYDEIYVSSYEQLGTLFAINKEADNIIDKSFQVNIRSDYDIDEFSSASVPVYFSSTKDYFNILDNLAGRVNIVAVSTANTACQYDNEWSAGKGSYSENRASRQLLEFMLSSAAQDIWYMGTEGSSGIRDGILPINKSSFKTYTVETYYQLKSLYDIIEKYYVEEAISYE